MSLKLKKQGRGISPETLHEQWYQPWAALFPLRKQRSSKFNAVDVLVNAVGVSCSEAYELLAVFHQPFRRHAEAAAGIGSILHMIKSRKIGLGIISNTPLPGEFHQKTLQDLGLLLYFDSFSFSYDLGVRKPCRKIFHHALNSLGVQPSEVVMIGDNYQADLVPVKAIGMNVVLFTPFDECLKAADDDQYGIKRATKVSELMSLFSV